MLALASDFDHTIYFDKEDVPLKPQTVAAVRKLRQAGHKFGFCTGRLKDAQLTQVADVLDADFYILISGALILNKEREIIHGCPMDWELLKQLNSLYTSGCGAAILTKDVMYIIGKNRPYGTHIESLDEIKETVYGFSLELPTPERAHEIADEVKMKFGGLLNAFPNKWYLDIVSAGCSKGTGIEFVKNHYGIDIIGGVGDSYNDLPMLREADISFTFTYAPENVQHQADNVVESAAEAIEIFLKQAQ